MTREHDIEDIVRRLLDHHARINAGLSFDETPPATSVYSEAASALSSLAAEIGRMAAVVEAATMLRHSGYDSRTMLFAVRTMLFAVMCDAVDKYAALSSPAPEGTDGGDEVVP